MTLNMESFDAAIKEHYKPLRVRDMVYRDHPLLAMMPKYEKWGGDVLPVPIKFGNPQGRSATFATAQANKGNSRTTKFNLTRVKDYSLASIDNETIKATQGNSDAFMKAFTFEMDGAIASLSSSLAIALYGNGNGSRGTVGAYTATQSVFTLTNLEDITSFEVGMKLVASAADGGALRAGSATITAVNRDTGVITTGSAWDTQITGFTANDYLYVQGDAANGGAKLMVSGLDAYIPATVTSTPFFGVDRTVDPTRLAGQRIDATGMPIEEGLIQSAARLGREGGNPTHIFLDYGQYSNLEKALGSKVVYDKFTARVGDNATIGFEGIKLHGPKGPLMVIPDQNCQANIAWMLQLDTWCLNSLGAAPHILDEDGNKMLRESGSDAYEIRFGYYANVSCEAPGWNARILLV